MRGDRRKRKAKTETIRQVNILTDFAKLLTKETLSVERLPHQRFRRGHVHVYGVDPGACQSPASRGNVFLQGGPGVRVILLEPHVVDRAFIVEGVIRILLEPFEVFEKSVRHKL